MTDTKMAKNKQKLYYLKTIESTCMQISRLLTPSPPFFLCGRLKPICNTKQTNKCKYFFNQD